MTRAKSTASHHIALAYLACLFALSLVVGIGRSLFRSWDGTLLSQYLAHSVAVNGALMLFSGLVSLPIFLALRFGLRRVLPNAKRTGDLAAIAGFIVSYLLYWGLNSTVSRRMVREFKAGKTEPAYEEILHWAPGILGVALLGWWLFASKQPRKVLVRCAWVSGLLLAVAAGLRVYSSLSNPSNVSALDIQSSARRHPDVFLVLVDTLRADHLSAYGYPLLTSPNVDALAEEAVLHERGFAPAPWTRPSCGTLLTSRNPQELGLKGFNDLLPAEVPILPEYLRAEGYRTAGVVSSVQVSSQFGFDKGFDLLDTGLTFLKFTGNMRAIRRLQLDDSRDNYPRYNAEELTDRAMNWVRKNEKSAAPLFMYLHYSDPHYPYLPPPEQDRWREFATEAAIEFGRPVVPPRRNYDASTGEVSWSGSTPTQPEVDSMVARYDAEIAFFDHHFGRLLNFLKETGRYDNAVIIVTADHGEEFGEHGGWRHDHSLFNELLHVPLIIKYPKRFSIEARRVSEPAGLIDVVPTLREVLGAQWPQSAFRGRSLFQVKADEPTADAPIFARSDRPPLRALYRGSDKLIQILGVEGSVIEEKYFSLDQDFPEAGDGELPQDLSEERLASLRRTIKSLDALSVPSETIELDAETLNELRALGYIK